MNKKLKVWTVLSGVFGLLFVLFTVLVKTIDVEVVGEAGSEVGFAFLNRPFMKTVGKSDLWLKVSELFGIVALLLICLFVGIGLIKWIKRKSLKQVDYQIYALAMLCVCVVMMYILFEILVINKRPILVDGELEASYPSTHTLIAICSFGSAITMINYLVKNKKLKIAFNCACVVFATLVVIGRTLSGVHWITDIIASMLLSGLLLSVFNALVNCEKVQNLFKKQ